MDRLILLKLQNRTYINQVNKEYMVRLMCKTDTENLQIRSGLISRL